MANNDKNRKSEIQERFDVAANDGRFAGDGKESQEAKEAALKQGAKDTTGFDPYNTNYSNAGGVDTNDEASDAEAHRNPSQANDYKGEAQNVNDGDGRPMDNNQEEQRHARNKAHSGSKDNDAERQSR